MCRLTGEGSPAGTCPHSALPLRSLQRGGSGQVRLSEPLGCRCMHGSCEEAWHGATSHPHGSDFWKGSAVAPRSWNGSCRRTWVGGVRLLAASLLDCSIW